jgi:hypothetical protein
MDDLNKKKSGKHTRQRPTPPACEAPAGVAAPPQADGHAPDGAALPGAAQDATQGSALFAAAGTRGTRGKRAALPAKAPIAAAVSALPAAQAADAAPSIPARPEAANGPIGAGPVQDARMAAPQAASRTADAPGIVPAPGRKERVKTVRDSFAVPKDDHATLAALKEACRAHGVRAKKNQLLRVAIGLLRDVEPARLAQLVAALPPTARKKK